MSRICPHCGTANDTRATFCGACATQMASTSTALVPVRQASKLPALSQGEKATLGSVALGLAAVALRVGVKLIQQASARPAAPAAPPAASGNLRIRRRWVVGDRFGPQRWGEEEIEVEDTRATPGAYRIHLK